MEVKPHSLEESKDKVVMREIENDDNDKYVYYFFIDRSPAISQ